MDFSYIIELCSPDIYYLDNNFYKIFYAMFISGLFGGFLHCSYMCSPFLMMQISTKMENDEEPNFTEFTRLKRSLLLPYHVGRIITYGFLGALTSYVTGYISGWWEDIASFLLLISGALIILFGLNPKFYGRIITTPIFVKKIISLAYGYISTKSGFLSNFIIGVVLGFLPCAMLYSAIIAAASIGNPYSGAISMIFFGLGTIPGLFISAFSGHYVLEMIRSRFKLLPKIIIILTGLWMCYISYNIFISQTS